MSRLLGLGFLPVAVGLIPLVSGELVDYSNITRENLERVADNRIRRYLEGPVARDYQLTPAQKERFKQRLLELKKEQVEYTLGTLAERKAAVEAAHPHHVAWRQATRPSQPTPEFIEHMAKVTSFNEKNPLFREPNVVVELEKLLPEQQVRAGRKSRDARQAHSQAMDSRRARAEGYLESGRIQGGYGVRLLAGTRDEWEVVVRQFCEFFSLREDQVATANAVFREVRSRRDEYWKRHEGEIETAFWTGQAATPGLFGPIDALWEELRTRLDNIPTGEQIAAVKQRHPQRPATRPTDYFAPSTATRPATTAEPRGTQTQAGP